MGSFAAGEFRNNFRAVSPQVTPNWEKTIWRLLRNWQRLAGVVSTLVSTENAVLETMPAVRTAEVRSQVRTRNALFAGAASGALWSCFPPKRRAPRKWQLQWQVAATKKERIGLRAVSLLDLSDVREESCRRRDLADLSGSCRPGRREPD
jgi:hypothetical protein